MEQTFSAATRSSDLAAMAGETLDVLVVGGGITGAGVARDAAMRGLKTGLVDAGDFAGGTSSRSSRLIHGGLRYLEHGWLRLVFEASRERRTLLRLAPHLVTPCPFLFPAFRGSRLKRWQISAGVFLYDALALFRNVKNHRLLGRAGVLREEPLLRDQDLTGGAIYWDAQCDDARLTVATARSARRHGARCASYTRVTAFERAGGHVRGANLLDTIGGATHAVRAHVVVNATGPWSDAVRRLDDPSAKPLLRATKGAHIAVPRARIGNKGAVTMTSPVDGRVMFVLPHGDATIIGTTDTDTTVPPDDVMADASDVIYLLRSANAAFPSARLQVDDVIAAWAGLRPLLDHGDRHADAVPREHHIEESAGGLVSIMGGKLTTYRAMSAQVVDVVARRLRSMDGRNVPGVSGSDRERLPGGEVPDPSAVAANLEGDGLDAAEAMHLALAYGSEAPSIAALIRADASLGEHLVAGGPWLTAEVVHHARREMAMNVADILMRRLHVFHQMRGHGVDAAPRVAALLGAELGWTADDVAAAAAGYRAEVDRLDSALTTAP